MRDLSRLSGSKILSVKEPEAMFSFDAVQARREYRELAKRWHPDVCSDSGGVFAHILQLFIESEEKRAKHKWEEPAETIEAEEPGVKAFKTDKGFIRKVDYRIVREFELGVSFIGDHHVTYCIDREYEDLFRNGLRQIKGFSYRDEKMKLEMMKYLPQIQDEFFTSKYCVVTFRKTPDMLLLRDVLGHMGGEVKPMGHIGWIVNVAYNCACFTHIMGLTHNDISLDTYFVSPLRHSGMLLGGWWYSRPRRESILALPDRSVLYMPPDVLRRKTTSFRGDLELIKALARELLGDASGARLKFNEDIPKPLVDYLTFPSSGSAVKDYKIYKQEVLEACWPKKFIKLELEAKDLYAGAIT